MGIVRQALGLQTLSETPSEPEGPTGNYSAQVTPPSRAAQPHDPIALPAFYRGVVVITHMASPLALNAVRGSEVVANALVAQPDPWMSRRRFLARTVIGLVLYGNAYWRKLRNASGDVTGVRVADRGRAYYGKGGQVRYQLVFGMEVVDLPASEVEHLRFLEMPGMLDGLGPVQACRMALEGIAAVREYADQWFDSGDAVSGVLSTDQPLQAHDRKAYKKAWYTRDEEDPAGGPGVKVLGSGLTYTPYFLKPKDAQWIEAQSWGVLDIARLLGLPGDYLLAAVEGSSLIYTTLEMIDTSMVKRTLLPDYLQPIEEALSNVIPRGQAATFDLADFLRPDAKTRADIDAIYVDKQVYGPDYIRRRDRITDPGITSTDTTEEPAAS